MSSGGNQEQVDANLEATAIDAQTSSYAAQIMSFIIPSANAAPTNDPQKTAFFNAVDAPLTALANNYGIPSSWLIGLYAYESGWLNAHNTSLMNPFGLTQAGGNNQSFSSYSDAFSEFDALYGKHIIGATSPQDFAQRMEGVLNGSPVAGWNKYNSVNPGWEKGLVDVINSVPARENVWKAQH